MALFLHDVVEAVMQTRSNTDLAWPHLLRLHLYPHSILSCISCKENMCQNTPVRHKKASRKSSFWLSVLDSLLPSYSCEQKDTCTTRPRGKTGQGIKDCICYYTELADVLTCAHTFIKSRFIMMIRYTPEFHPSSQLQIQLMLIQNSFKVRHAVQWHTEGPGCLCCLFKVS